MIPCACAIFIREGRLLLARRAPHKVLCPDCWDVIGGHVETGETMEQALVREAIEEVGLTPLKFTAAGSILKGDPGSKDEAAYHFFVVLEWSGGEPKLLGEEHTEFSWFTIEEACALEALAIEEYRTLFRNLPPLCVDAGFEIQTSPTPAMRVIAGAMGPAVGSGLWQP